MCVCVTTSMLLERLRSWSCVYRMGREGGACGGRQLRGKRMEWGGKKEGECVGRRRRRRRRKGGVLL